MARIRTIKPEFWASEQVMECSPMARLLFIGLWNFCDDAGNHVASERTIKAEIFPGDDISSTDVRRLLDELLSNGLLVGYSSENKDFLHVTGWQHQKIDRPTFKHPPFRGENPRVTRRALDEASPPEGKGREGKGEEGKELESPDGDSSPGSQPPLTLGEDEEPGDPPGVPPCPVKRIVEAYHRELPMLARVRALPDQAERMLRTRWREAPERQRLQWWEEFFAYVRTCPFLVGEKTDFQADLLWLVRPTNFAKVVNGNYEVRSA